MLSVPYGKYYSKIGPISKLYVKKLSNRRLNIIMTLFFQYYHAEERFDISFNYMIDYVMFWHKHMMISL